MGPADAVEKKPLLSVVISSYNARKTIGECLGSLEEQTAAGSFEVIVVDSSSDGTADLVEERFPRAALLRFRKRMYCGDARNAGLAAAAGEIIAFIDADCTAERDWAEKILLAHRSPVPAVGGAIGNRNPESCVGWGAYFTEFSRWMPGTKEGWMSDIAGANMSYRRGILEEFGPFLGGTYSSDTDFHWRLKRGGCRLRFDPSILVHHRNIDRAGKFFGHEFDHGRNFARVRSGSQEFPPWKRLAYAVLFLPIAAKLFLEVTLRSWENETGRKPFRRAFPMVALGILFWSAGEAVGYLQGAR